ncbi:hypothetical protein Dfri01_59570 [Dyadobacter frigoris]|nr:hypothetical protein Dfri01_59570 [Dyadobacter frigoris]
MIISKKRKGKYELMYRIYSEYIDTLSFKGAAEVISDDLGISIGLDTIRGIRKLKSNSNGTDWGRDKAKGQTSIIPQNEKRSHKPVSTNKKLDYLNSFKAIDVFEEEKERESGFKLPEKA